MIILDTNVVSETMRPQPNPQVRQWLNAQAAETLYLTSITLAEIRFGIAALPDGKRRQNLSHIADGIQQLFNTRILPFDLMAAQSYALLATHARQQGLGFPIPDGYIAAIAAAHGYMIATRDTAPFLAVGLQVVNPWQTYEINTDSISEPRLQQTGTEYD